MPAGKPTGKPSGKRKSPDDSDRLDRVDSESPDSRRNNDAGNGAMTGPFEDGAVMGVPVKMMQEQSKAAKIVNDGAESRPADEGAEGRSRLVWSQELHNRFLNALSHLGLKQAVPKSILTLMEVDGMTRENVASHLQKYRLFLRKLGGFSSKDKLTVEQLQDLHEENIKRMATQEALVEAAVSVDEADSNAAVEQAPRLRNVVDGIPITGAMHIGVVPNALKQVEMELLDPRNLQYPEMLAMHHQHHHQSHPQPHHYHQPHHSNDDLFEEKSIKADETEEVPEKEIVDQDDELLIQTHGTTTK